VSLVASGGASVPAGDFAHVAELGLVGAAGAVIEVGTTGLAISGIGFFASNPHEISGDRSDLYGFTVSAGYTLLEVRLIRIRAWAGLSGMVHARRSDGFPGLNASRRGVAAGGGATVSRPVRSVRLFASALYSRGLGDLGRSSFPTEWVTLSAGVAVPLRFD
jgi:hypothetical protein